MCFYIIDAFNEYFEMVPACSCDLKKEVYKLRYQVYCNETGFENPEHYPEKIEFDDYDKHSIHYLIRHRKSDVFAATTRLILPDVTNIEKLFPIENFSQIDNVELLKNVPRINIAEASRFCVSKEFKRRKNEPDTLTGINSDLEMNFTGDERRVFPYLTIALFTCLIKMSEENDIYFWYAVMEPALIRYFSSLGIYFVGIGPLVDYHGIRQPCMIKVSDLLDGVAKKDLSLNGFIELIKIHWFANVAICPKCVPMRQVLFLIG